jgi:hypothetical protein
MLIPIFRDFISQNLDISEYLTLKVAVVGGSELEPEIEVLRDLQLDFTTDFFGIDDNSIMLDLNVDYLSRPWEHRYDIIICCQVLEHVWNTSIAIKNITSLARFGGLLWINCPASNHAHGSPEYFSAGYQSEYLVKNCNLYGFNAVASGEIGSERLYKMTHHQFFWPSETEHKMPFLRGYGQRNYLFPLKFFRNILKNFQALLWNGKTVEGTRYSTESYCAGIKLPSTPE